MVSGKSQKKRIRNIVLEFVSFFSMRNYLRNYPFKKCIKGLITPIKVSRFGVWLT